MRKKSRRASVLNYDSVNSSLHAKDSPNNASFAKMNGFFDKQNSLTLKASTEEMNSYFQKHSSSEGIHVWNSSCEKGTSQVLDMVYGNKESNDENKRSIVVKSNKVLGFALNRKNNSILHEKLIGNTSNKGSNNSINDENKKSRINNAHYKKSKKTIDHVVDKHHKRDRVKRVIQSNPRLHNALGSAHVHRHLFIGFLLLMVLMLAPSVFAQEQLVSLQGKITDNNGNLLTSGNVTVTIWDAETGGSLVYNSSRNFSNNISNGFFDITLGSIADGELELNLSQTYWMDLQINDEDIDWNGAERRQFQSPVGYDVSGSDNFTVDTNVLFVDSLNDRVGIGTSSPTAELHINDSISPTLLIDDGDGRTLKILGPSSGSDAIISSYSNLYLGGTTDATDLTISSSNLVGIGTTSPSEKLVVIGNVNISGTLNVSGRVAFPNLANCDTIDTDANGVLTCGTDDGGAGGNNNSLWNESGTNLYPSDLEQNIGIGTVSPAERLVVIGNVNISGTLNVSGTATFENIVDIRRTEDSEFIRLTDGTNSDSVGIYSGSGSPEGVVTAQIGSLYMDNSGGALYKKEQDGGSSGWFEVQSFNGSNQHMAKMTRDAAQSINNDVETTIEFDTINFSTGIIADNTAGIGSFNITKSGVYFVSASGQLDGPDDQEYSQLQIFVNGESHRDTLDYAPGTDLTSSFDVNTVLELESGDYVTLVVRQNSGGSQNTETTLDRKMEMTVIQLDPSLAAAGGWSDVGDTIELQNSGDDISAGVLAVNNTIGQVKVAGVLNVTDTVWSQGINISGIASGTFQNGSDIWTGFIGINTSKPNAALEINQSEDSEFIRLTDGTNSDSVGIYSGSGNPEGVVTAEIGSMYFDNNLGFIYRKTTDGGNTGWVELAGEVNGTDSVVQVIYGSNDTWTADTSTIPVDDTIPQITEGTEIVKVNITPRSPSNILIIRAEMFFATSASTSVTGALFQDGISNALYSSAKTTPAANQGNKVTIEHIMTAGTTENINISFRAGTQAGTFYLNGISSGRLFGGTSEATLVVTEISPNGINATAHWVATGSNIAYEEGNVTVDSTDNTLFVDAENNKVGVGTSALDTLFKAAGDINITGTVWSQGVNITAGGVGGSFNNGSDIWTRFLGINTTEPNAYLEINASEDSEFIRLTDGTNSDSVGIYSGSGSPEGVVTAQIGSLYMDNSGGALYKKEQDGGTAGWFEVQSFNGSNQHMAEIRSNVAQSISDTTNTKADFTHINFSTGIIADTDVDTLNITKGGTYLVVGSFGLNLGTDGESMFTQIYKNGVAVSTGTVTYGNVNSVVARDTALLQLNPGDYLELYVYQNSVGSENTLTLHEVQPTLTAIQIDPNLAAAGGWSDTGDTIELQASGDSISANALVVNNTNSTVRVLNANFTVEDLTNCDTIDTDANGRFICGSDANSGGTFTNNSDINVTNFVANNTLFVNGSRVGIGTDSPEAGLDILTQVSAASGYAYGLRVEQNLTASSFGDTLIGALINITFDDNTQPSVNSYGLLVPNGNIGFGTTTPSQRLDVIGAAQFLDENSNYVVIGNSVPSGSRGVNILYDNTNDGTMIQSIHQGTSAKPLFLNPNGGNVGINTTNPQEKLVVIGNVNISGTLNVSGRVAFPNLASCDTIDTDANGVLTCGTDATTAGGDDVSGSGATGFVVLWNETNTINESVIYQSNGLIGIGTVDPSYKFQVEGSANISNGQSGIQVDEDGNIRITLSP